MTFLVHEDVLSLSPVFGAMCKSRFTEGQTQKIMLPEDDPVIIRRILDYFYSRRYDVESETSAERITEFASLFIYADKYQLPHLQKIIIDDLFPMIIDLRKYQYEFYAEARRVYDNTAGAAHEAFRSWFRDQLGSFLREGLDPDIGSGQAAEDGSKKQVLAEVITAGGDFALDFHAVLYMSAYTEQLTVVSVRKELSEMVSEWRRLK